MSTAWAEVITNYGLVAINDIRLYEELETNPALFFRKMAQYMANAIPLFNRPPEIVSYMYVYEPTYADYSFTVPSNPVFPLTIGTELTEFELCKRVLVMPPSKVLSPMASQSSSVIPKKEQAMLTSLSKLTWTSSPCSHPTLVSSTTYPCNSNPLPWGAVFSAPHFSYST